MYPELDVVKNRQEDHGGWNDKMASVREHNKVKK